MAEPQRIEKREITDELRESYLDYAMSVIVGRALPDVRDSLKPVHRRILWAMWDTGLTWSSKLRKSANVVGEVLGRYHPHGDVAVYDALVRMAQPFSLRYPLIHGQGNFGSVDGDSAAAMRYTEAKLSKIAEELLQDINKETVNWIPNYDGTRVEPSVLPAKLPNLLVNGSVGIAVGMATNIPPHNLGEVIEATKHLIDHPKATSEDLLQYVQGPDFPTGGVMYDKKAITEAYLTGRGAITTRALAEIVERKGGSGRDQFDIVITEIPYQVNKAELIIKIAELVQEKRIEGIRDVRDESDREGLRIVIELKTDAAPQKILNQLWQHTDLQKDFHLNMVALVDGLKPQVLSLKDVIFYYIEHRKEVVRRRAEFDLKVAKDREHILEGLAKALSVIDKIIATIKKSADKDEAHTNLMKSFKLSDLQATAILEMRLQALAALERQKIEDELKEKRKLIKDLEALLSSPQRILSTIKDELTGLTSFADERKTKLHSGGLKEFQEEDLVPQEEVVITLSQNGYIKRVPPKTFKSQKRGGKGLIGSDVGEEDFLAYFVSADTHDDILFFTDHGRVFKSKVYNIPVGSRTSKGKAVHNFLNIPVQENISAIITYAAKSINPSSYLVMVTSLGMIKKTKLQDFANIRANGLIALGLRKGDLLKWVKLSDGKQEIMIGTKFGQSIRFKESQARPMGRTAAGVRGITLHKDDTVISFDLVDTSYKSNLLLAVMDNGYAKTTPLTQYKVQNRGGKGIKTAEVTKKTGSLVALTVLTDEEELLSISTKGQILRTSLGSIRKTGRAAQGVRIMRLNPGDKIAGVICL